MTAYRCLAVSPDGRSRWRMIEAPSSAAATAQLGAEGLVPLEVRELGTSLWQRLNRPLEFGGRLRLGEQALLLDQLALLVRSGLAVDKALDLLSDQAPRAGQRAILVRMTRRVRDGGGLALAFGAESGFPAYVGGIVRAAERGGRLGEALGVIAARLRTTLDTRRGLVTALAYPAAVLAATLVSLILVLTLVVPQFEPIFEGEEARLPLLTQGVLGLSRAVNGHLWLLVGGVLLSATAVAIAVRSTAGQQFITRHRARLPGMALRDQYLGAQFCGIFATLVGNGIGVVPALALAREGIGSRRWRTHLIDVERRVREGGRLSAALAQDGLLASTAIRLIEVGERSGQLAETAARASTLLGEASAARIARVVALANPIAIVGLGGLVALLVAGVMLGIFSIGDFAG